MSYHDARLFLFTLVCVRATNFSQRWLLRHAIQGSKAYAAGRMFLSMMPSAPTPGEKEKARPIL